MVLTSIIIGLGITHLLLGLSATIDRVSGDKPMMMGWVSWLWLTFLFVWMIQFWWWEYRLLEILKNWSQWNYLLVISYAVALFLLVAILVPRKWDLDDLNQHFLSKRRWFYSLFLLAFAIDVMDSYMKGGWPYIRAAGLVNYMQQIAALPAAVIGFRSAKIRVHLVLAALFLAWQIIIGFNVFPLLKL